MQHAQSPGVSFSWLGKSPLYWGKKLNSQKKGADVVCLIPVYERSLYYTAPYSVRNQSVLSSYLPPTLLRTLLGTMKLLALYLKLRYTLSNASLRLYIYIIGLGKCFRILCNSQINNAQALLSLASLALSIPLSFSFNKKGEIIMKPIYTQHASQSILKIFSTALFVPVWSLDTAGYSDQQIRMSLMRQEQMCSLLNHESFKPEALLVTSLCNHPATLWGFSPVMDYSEALELCESRPGYTPSPSRLVDFGDIHNLYWSQHQPHQFGTNAHGECYLIPHAYRPDWRA